MREVSMVRTTALAALDQLLAYQAELGGDGRLACDRDLRSGLDALGRALEHGTGRADAVIAAFWSHALERTQARFGTAATARALEGELARLRAGTEGDRAGHDAQTTRDACRARAARRGLAPASGSIWSRAPAHRARAWPTRWSGRPGAR